MQGRFVLVRAPCAARFQAAMRTGKPGGPVSRETFSLNYLSLKDLTVRTTDSTHAGGRTPSICSGRYRPATWHPAPGCHKTSPSRPACTSAWGLRALTHLTRQGQRTLPSLRPGLARRRGLGARRPRRRPPQGPRPEGPRHEGFAPIMLRLPATVVSRRQIHAVQEALEAGVGAQAVKTRVPLHKGHLVVALLIPFFEPLEGLIFSRPGVRSGPQSKPG